MRIGIVCETGVVMQVNEIIISVEIRVVDGWSLFHGQNGVSQRIHLGIRESTYAFSNVQGGAALSLKIGSDERDGYKQAELDSEDA